MLCLQEFLQHSFYPQQKVKFEGVVIGFVCFHRIWHLFRGLEVHDRIFNWTVLQRSARMGHIRLQRGPGWERE